MTKWATLHMKSKFSGFEHIFYVRKMYELDGLFSKSYSFKGYVVDSASLPIGMAISFNVIEKENHDLLESKTSNSWITNYYLIDILCVDTYNIFGKLKRYKNV